MSRNYTGIRPKLNRAYSAEQVCALYGICRNTLGNWVASGLRPSDTNHPRIFRGAELTRFHEERQGIRAPLRRGQFKCLRCKTRVFPETETLRFLNGGTGPTQAFAICPDCGASISKILNETNRDIFKTCHIFNTSLNSLDEENTNFPALIGQNPEEPRSPPPSPNDRLLFEWQSWAARYDEKTIEAKLRTIRQFEVFCRYKLFGEVTSEDAAAWRDALLSGQDGAGQDKPLSRATIQHHAAHLRAFFTWLAKRPGYRGLSAVPDYLELPRRFAQKSLPKAKGYPAIEEAVELLATMPTEAQKDRRARAIYACAYIFGLRANALITLPCATSMWTNGRLPMMALSCAPRTARVLW